MPDTAAALSPKKFLLVTCFIFSPFGSRKSLDLLGKPYASSLERNSPQKEVSCQKDLP